MAQTQRQLSSAASHVNERASFQQLTDDYRYELLIHCYRMLGSVEDAEDGLQETLLRAWRRFDTLKDRSALRAWLYRIATNICLDMLDQRKVRLLPNLTHAPAEPENAPGEPLTDPLWLDPLPESYLDTYGKSPEQHYEALEHVSLAFLVALQRLPGRQRAVLLLCDVLDWKAQEVADALNISVAAVNSALQRARATLKKHQHTQTITIVNHSTTPDMSDLLSRYVQAWETADSASLIALLREDGALTMPPFPTWFRGRAAIQTFLDQFVFARFSPGSLRMVATRANNSPAFALYQRDDSGAYQLSALHILTIQDGQITQIDDFITLDNPLYRKFNLPRPD